MDVEILKSFRLVLISILPTLNSELECTLNSGIVQTLRRCLVQELLCHALRAALRCFDPSKLGVLRLC